VKPAGRSESVIERLGRIYVHRSARRRPRLTLRVSPTEGRYIADSMGALNGDPPPDEYFARGSGDVFSINVEWEAA